MAIRNVPLSPDALITQDQADELDERLDEYEEANDDFIEARAEMDQFYALRAFEHGQAISDATGEDHAVDLYGDGKLKKFDQLELAPGLQPAYFERKNRRVKTKKATPADVKSRSERGHSVRRPPGERRHPLDAVVTVGDMIKADKLSDDVRDALIARRDTALALNEKLNELMRPVGLEMMGDESVDVFGDGLVKNVNDIKMPEFLSLIKKRGNKMLGHEKVKNVLTSSEPEPGPGRGRMARSPSSFFGPSLPKPPDEEPSFASTAGLIDAASEKAKLMGGRLANSKMTKFRRYAIGGGIVSAALAAAAALYWLL